MQIYTEGGEAFGMPEVSNIISARYSDIKQYLIASLFWFEFKDTVCGKIKRGWQSTSGCLNAVRRMRLQCKILSSTAFNTLLAIVVILCYKKTDVSRMLSLASPEPLVVGDPISRNLVISATIDYYIINPVNCRPIRKQTSVKIYNSSYCCVIPWIRKRIPGRLFWQWTQTCDSRDIGSPRVACALHVLRTMHVWYLPDT